MDGGKITRGEALMAGGIAAAGALVAGSAGGAPAAGLRELVEKTPFIDTHEHLVEEERRTDWKPVGLVPCDDWGLLFTHYIDSDLLVAGMPPADMEKLRSPHVDGPAKWKLIEPFWPAVRNTGYGQAVRQAVRRIYGINELGPGTIGTLADRYRSTVKPGFYRTLLRGMANIESCQVNSLEATFMETSQPDLLMQDISILSLAPGGRPWTHMVDRDGAKATDLAGYHRAIDYVFEKHARRAVAVKSQAAYGRRIDFEDVPAERAEPLFAAAYRGDKLTAQQAKQLDDHIFWYCVRKATAAGLPVKLHTGYFAGQGGMPLEWVAQNAADASLLLRRSPDTTFVLMHMGYPFHEQMIALAKHYHNAVIDMCWAWIISPTASERFLRDFLVTAPANKVLTFGGDFIPVECVVGHAAVARQGIARAIGGLVADGLVPQREAEGLVPMVMNGNARRIFRLAERAGELAGR